MKLRRIIIALMTLWILSGCVPALKGDVDPSAGLPEINGTDTGDKPIYGKTNKWWESFNDPMLNELVEEALDNNLDIAQGYERMLQAGALARETGAARYPWVSAEGTARRQGAEGPMGNEVITTTYSASVTARYELDLWGKLSSRSRAAALEARASREQLKALYMTISASIAENYFTILEQKEQQELTRRTMDAMEKTRKLVELRYAKGVANTLDVYQARQNLANASVQGPVFESSIASSLAELNLLMGRDPRLPLELDRETLPDAPAFPDYIPSNLLERRPDVQAALLAVQARDERVAAAIADRFPSFNLVGTYGGASDTLSEVLQSENIVWSILLDIALPVFEAGKRKAAVERNRAAFMESLKAYHEAVLTALKEIHVSLLRNSLTRERVSLLEDSVSSGENTLRVAREQYLQGISDYLNVLNAQQALYSAKSSLLSGRRQLLSDRIQLARALGGAWMEDEVVSMENNRMNDKAEHDGN